MVCWDMMTCVLVDAFLYLSHFYL